MSWKSTHQSIYSYIYINLIHFSPCMFVKESIISRQRHQKVLLPRQLSFRQATIHLLSEVLNIAGYNALILNTRLCVENSRCTDMSWCLELCRIFRIHRLESLLSIRKKISNQTSYKKFDDSIILTITLLAIPDTTFRCIPINFSVFNKFIS